MSWENCNESMDLMNRVELYKQERGYCPERVCAGAIYMTAENKRFCELHDIRLGERGLSKTAQARVETAEQQDLFNSDTRKRSVIEGRIGTGKRIYGLDTTLTKLVSTSEPVIGMAFFVMNTETAMVLLRLFIFLFAFLCVAVCRLIENWLKGAILELIWPAQAWFLCI
jgi:hypothetical protein